MTIEDLNKLKSLYSEMTTLQTSGTNDGRYQALRYEIMPREIAPFMGELIDAADRVMNEQKELI